MRRPGFVRSPLRAAKRVLGRLCACGSALATVGDELAHIEHAVDGEGERWCPVCNVVVSLDVFVAEHFEHARRCASVRATRRVRREERKRRAWAERSRVPERPRQMDVFESFSRLDEKAAALERMIRRARARNDLASVARLESMLSAHVRRAHDGCAEPLAGGEVKKCVR